MSYSIIDDNMLTDNQEMINMKGGDIQKKKRNHQGELNPHFNHPHSNSAKAAISRTQKLRYKTMAELVKRGMQNPLSEERIMEIVRQTCSEYLAKNAKPIGNNYKTIDIRL